MLSRKAVQPVVRPMSLHCGSRLDRQECRRQAVNLGGNSLEPFPVREANGAFGFRLRSNHE